MAEWQRMSAGGDGRRRRRQELVRRTTTASWILSVGGDLAVEGRVRRWTRMEKPIDDRWSTAWPEGQGREGDPGPDVRKDELMQARPFLSSSSLFSPSDLRYSICTVHVCSGLPAGIPIRLFEFDVYLLHAQSATLVPDPADAREGQD